MTPKAHQILNQCRDAINLLPIDSWDDESRPKRRAAGIVGYWVIQRAFDAVLVWRGLEMPGERSLVALWKQSGLPLDEETAAWLPLVDEVVAADGPDEDDAAAWDAHFTCCMLARGIVQTAQQSLTLSSISSGARQNNPHKSP